ncbi:hypothetical protein C8Q74DRAFT_1364141 [Fomes fomentarius]|nr:hypothetical protein C8Q74DRAFT_1364141 [Fomes fomentarius]
MSYEMTNAPNVPSSLQRARPRRLRTRIEWSVLQRHSGHVPEQAAHRHPFFFSSPTTAHEFRESGFYETAPMRDVMQDMATYSRSSSRLLETPGNSKCCPLTATRDGRENARKEALRCAFPARRLLPGSWKMRDIAGEGEGEGDAATEARMFRAQTQTQCLRLGQVRRPPGKARTRTTKP